MIEARAVVKIYGEGVQEVHALRGVDLRISPGDFMAIAGPSGSGKTTFLNILGGLDQPTSGEVDFEGTILGELDARGLARLRREKLGFIFQSYNLVPVLGARENVELGLMIRGAAEASRRKIAMGALEAVGLEGLEERRPNELSGGQQQRVAVARAIAGGPAMILADEPTANLDSKTAGDLLDLFESLNKDQNVTFLFSSHDPQVLEKARKVVRFKDGRIRDPDPQSV